MEQVSLPIKTKIAVWWIMVTVGIGVIFSIIFAKLILRGPDISGLIFLPFILLPSPFLFFAGLLLWLIRKKWVWSLVIILLLIIIGFVLYVIYPAYKAIFSYRGWHWDFDGWFTLLYSVFATNIISFILLLLDRKNFWKIAT